MTLDATHFEARPVAEWLCSLPGIIVVREASSDHSVRFLSPSCLALTGYSAQELDALSGDGLTFNDLIYSEDLTELLARIDQAISTQQPYWVEYRVYLKSGELCWFLEQGAWVAADDAQAARVEGLITNISPQKQAQEQLQHDAFYDKLTGLPNRSLFIDRLSQAVRRIQRNPDYQFAVLFLDLDRFKVINDSLGHRAGDALLVQVATRLAGCIRPGDTVARLGGDEFTMLIDAVRDIADVTLVSERILNDMGAPFMVEGEEIFTTTSIGIALSSAGYGSSEDLIRDADIALYQAKALGKARYALFQPGMHIHAVARLQLENDLRRALQGQEFCLLYQPIVVMESGLLAGFEAFVYWQHPLRGLLAPMEFLPMLQEMGLLVQLGQWVLRAACQQMSRWHERFPRAHAVFISVNLASPEFAHPDLVTVLQSVLQESKLNPACLRLEITESTLMSDSEAVLDRLQAIKALGVQLGVDDFGTGYSSLSYLDQFPIDFLKIDRSFVARADTSENLEIIRTILTLALSLGLTTVAEGMESTTQVAQLRALRCELGQGFVFARPLDALQALRFFEEQFCGEVLTSITVSLPRLLIRSTTGQYQLLLIGRTSWSLGRAQDCSFFLPDRMVSREHAMVLQLPLSCEFYLVDLGSRNGSFVNSQRVKTPTLLRNGDLIRIGKTEMQFLAAAALESPNALPMVLMHQPSKMQGQIWREVLLAQGVSIIWQTHDFGLLQTLQQLEAAGEPLPHLLLLDIETLPLPWEDFFEWLRLHYPTLPLVLTMAAHYLVDPPLRLQAIHLGAIDLLPGFRLRGTDLFRNAHDIALTVLRVLRLLPAWASFDELSLEQAAIDALQSVIRNETLF
ncbi:MAG TPA: EAL domain-containing protein [Stenomitos sp.]